MFSGLAQLKKKKKNVKSAIYALYLKTDAFILTGTCNIKY